MAKKVTYRKEVRGLWIQSIDDPTINYYFCIVDIPTTWSAPNHWTMKVDSLKNVLSYEADVEFGDVEEGPSASFTSFVLPVQQIKGAALPSFSLEARGNNPSKVKKTGTITNSAPVKI